MKNNSSLWPAGIILAFVLFLSGIATVIVISVNHRESLVSDRYYEQEIDYQNQLDSLARARTAGATIAYNAATARVVIGIPAGQLARNCVGSVAFYRPSAPELDREFTFNPTSDGPPSIDASSLASGPWKVTATWRAGGQEYYLDQRIVIAEK